MGVEANHDTRVTSEESLIVCGRRSLWTSSRACQSPAGIRRFGWRRLSKMAHFIPMATGAESPAKDLAMTFAREIWRLHGLPADIVSDRGSVFISGFWKELMEHLGVELNMSTAFHPRDVGTSQQPHWYGGRSASTVSPALPHTATRQPSSADLIRFPLSAFCLQGFAVFAGFSGVHESFPFQLLPSKVSC